MPLVRGWAVAQYVDDAVASVSTEHQHASWHYRSILPRLINQQIPRAYPLMTRALTAGVPLSLTLNGGGAAYVRFGIVGGATGRIVATSGCGALPATTSLTLVRTR